MLTDDDYDHTLYFLFCSSQKHTLKHSRQIVGVLHFTQAPALLQAAA